MTKVCMYFQVHQPKRLRKYTYFDIGNNHYYEDDEKNKNILLKVASKCYLPTNAILLDLIKKHNGRFKIAFSISGILIEQLKQFSQETLDSFKRLVDTGCVELLNETYYHSLSCLFSEKEFQKEIKLHKDLIEQEFGYKATTFRNTELIYNNTIAEWISKLGYKTILAEGADKILEWRSPNFVYQPINSPQIKLLLKNYKLSDDIAFRFGEKTWKEFPLKADKYSHWIHALYDSQIVNLFMDYETFGEHQWEATGIFEFLKHFPDYIMKHPDFAFVTPNEANDLLTPISTLDMPTFISWADEERDLTAWKGNELQEDALNTVYGLENVINSIDDDDELVRTWRTLLTSDHFYYMCTKYSQDGDVHKYFNPYNSPYEAYINFQNIMSDLSLEIKKRENGVI